MKNLKSSKNIVRIIVYLRKKCRNDIVRKVYNYSSYFCGNVTSTACAHTGHCFTALPQRTLFYKNKLAQCS